MSLEEIVRVLYIHTVYNEIDIIPHKMRWCDEQGFETYTFDNYSTDGTWEYLNEHGYPCARIDTDGAFDVMANCTAMKFKVHELKPDWVFYSGADLYVATLRCDGKIKNLIEEISRQGFNLIHLPKICIFHYTGTEGKESDPRRTYFYFQVKKARISLLSEYHPSLHIRPDHLLRRNPEVYMDEDTIAYEYKFRVDSKEKKTEALQRRQKAWDRGMSRAFGGHYIEMMRLDQWIWKPEKLLDIRKSPFYKVIQQGVNDE